MLKYSRHILIDSFGTNSYLVWDDDSKEAMLIDPAAPNRNLLDLIKKQKLRLSYIVLTHGHADHLGGVGYFYEELKPKVLIHALDAAMLPDPDLNLSVMMGQYVIAPEADVKLKDGDTITLGSKVIEVLHTPGHTKGGICLKHDKLLFSGDTLFQMGIGRTDLPGGSMEALGKSIKNKLFSLAEDTIVLPGHGGKTTIGDEEVANPYLGFGKNI